MPHLTPESLAAVAEGAMSVRQAMDFTGDSHARLYQLMTAGVLVWFTSGAHRRITRKSLVEYLARRLQEHDPAKRKVMPRKKSKAKKAKSKAGAGART